MEALIRAFGDRALPARARVALAGALYRLYLREADPTIFASLVGALDDPEPLVRSGVVGAIGNLRKPEAVAPLLRQLDVESDFGIQRDILTALEFVGLEGSEIRTSIFSEAQHPHPRAHAIERLPRHIAPGDRGVARGPGGGSGKGGAAALSEGRRRGCRIATAICSGVGSTQ